MFSNECDVHIIMLHFDRLQRFRIKKQDYAHVFDIDHLTSGRISQELMRKELVC